MFMAMTVMTRRKMNEKNLNAPQRQRAVSVLILFRTLF